jgi:hypothetical protein
MRPILQLKKKDTPILTSKTTSAPTETPLTLFPRGNDNSGSVAINFNFNYFGTFFSQLNIHTDGYVYFNSESSGIRISALNYDLITSSYYYDIDSDKRHGGGIYYQILNSQSSDFNSIKSDLNRLNSNFVPTNLFRIKYDNVSNMVVSNYDDCITIMNCYLKGGLVASFQIVLASDALKSYVLLKYTSCLSDAILDETPGLYYLSPTGQQMSNTISSPCSSSNVNQAGTWVFDVSTKESKKIIINDFI